MYSFRNDYSETAHPNILNALIETNMVQDLPYGCDSYSMKAAEMIKEKIGRSDADIHLLCAGTQTNLTAISSFLRPFESVVAADTAHIFTSETGAIEATGHKISAVPNKDGKLTPEQITEVLDFHNNEHKVKPRLVNISNATEVGTVYTKKELSALYEFCQKNDLLLYIDGARLGSALAASVGDLSLRDISELCDCFYIGGTKNGALMGEALVIVNDSLKSHFRLSIKQRGAMLSKSKVLGIQFIELMKDDLFIKLAAHSNKMADILREGIVKAGYKLFSQSSTNQAFPILPNEVSEKLSENFVLSLWEKVDDKSSVQRLVTSWATTEEAVTAFAEEIQKYKRV